MRNVSRIDDASRSTHCWLVQLQRQNRIVRKMFTDGVLGGKRKALAAALAWRDQQTEPLAQYVQELWRRSILRNNNSSGLVGVGRYQNRHASKGVRYAFWMASWIDENGVNRKRKFSVKRWGERAARRKAIETREQAVLSAVAARTSVSR